MLHSTGTDIHIGVMLPARLETRFIEPEGLDDQGVPNRHWRLKIAVIPDDPWMNRHSEIVSRDEARCLKGLWKAVEQLLADRNEQITEDALRAELRSTGGGQSAFRMLAQQAGSARAWWLVTNFAPDHFSDDDNAKTGRKGLSGMESLPERIGIWIGTDQGGSIRLQQLEPPMIINKSRMTFDDQNAFNLFTNGHQKNGNGHEAEVSDKRWWTKDAGLQAEYTLPFTDESELSTIEVIMAIGLGVSKPGDLFVSHRNAGLMSLLPLGAPTNTISGEPAADLAQDADIWWQLLQNPGETATRDDFAMAIAGDTEMLNAVPGGTGGHNQLNRELVSLLWPSLWGHTLKDVWCVDRALGWPGFSSELGLWAHELLKPEGPLAPLRIGDQPFGVLPVTRLNDGAWQPAPGDPQVEGAWLAQWLPRVRKQWAESALRNSGTVAGADTDKFLRLLGRVPSGSDYGYRTFLPLQIMYMLSSSLAANNSETDPRAWHDMVLEQTQNASDELGFPVKPVRNYITSGWRQDLKLQLVEPPPDNGPIAGFSTGWTHIVSVNNDSIFFYNASGGKGATARLNSNGSYMFVSSLSGFATGWTHIIGTPGGGILFYNAGSGKGATARIDEKGKYEFIAAESLTAGWTHIVSAGYNHLFFYNDATGRGAVSRLNANGRYQYVRAVTGFSKGWTLIIGTAGGGILFHNPDTGVTAAARIDSTGNYHGGSSIPDLPKGWTHITGAGSGYVLFYNSETGQGMNGAIESSGKYRFISHPSGIRKGWTHIRGAYSGGILFYDAETGNGMSAMFDRYGNVQMDDGSMFYAHLERIFELDEDPDRENLFAKKSDYCRSPIQSNSLLIRLILNSIALQYAEIGRMKETGEFSTLPLIENFDREYYCSDLEKWCQNVPLKFDDLLDDGIVSDFTGIDRRYVDGEPFIRQLRELIRTLKTWRENLYHVSLEEDGSAGGQLLADIERAFRATLDTAAHRIDPWITGMAWRRLQKLRGEKKTDGLGLYAWVDRPYTGSPGPTDGGTLLAPSHSQLITSLILRDKHINDPEADRWKIELDSHRIRLAKRFADEVRGGAHIQVVLGRAVEGIIGDDKKIKQLRREFPVRSEHAGRRVCDGQKILGILNSDGGDALLNNLGLMNGQRMELEELMRIADTYGDLLVANAVHDVVEGRPEKAGETMDAAAGLELPPELDLLHTPHSGESVNTTVWIALPSVDQPDPDAGDKDISPAHLADASVASWLEQAVPADQWQWSFMIDSETINVTLESMGLSVPEVLAYSEDGLQELARLHAGEDAEIDKTAAEGARKTLAAYRKLLRLTSLLSGQVRDGHISGSIDNMAGPDEIRDEPGAPGEREQNEEQNRQNGNDVRGENENPGEPDEGEDENEDENEDEDEEVERVGGDKTDTQYWRHHDSELRTRLRALISAAEALSEALNPEYAGEAELLRARRWGIAPELMESASFPPEDESVLREDEPFPPEDEPDLPDEMPEYEDFLITAEQKLKIQLFEARRIIQERIGKAEMLDHDNTPLHQISQAIAELSGIPMPVFGRVDPSALQVYGKLESGSDFDRTWLETVAVVRPALAKIEAHRLGPEPRLNAWCNHNDPWTFVDDRADTRVKQPMNVVVCYCPDNVMDDDPERGESAEIAVAVLDSWSEMIPDKRHLVETAFGFNAPSSRAPQAILLAVPPDESKPLDDETLAHIVLEARETAHARMATPDDLAPYASLFPFSMLPAQQPTGVSMNPDKPFKE